MERTREEIEVVLEAIIAVVPALPDPTHIAVALGQIQALRWVLGAVVDEGDEKFSAATKIEIRERKEMDNAERN